MQYNTNIKLGTLINVICKISVICLVALNERVRECSRTFHVIRRDPPLRLSVVRQVWNGLLWMT